ncbi:hypothetical protein JD844_020805 [Phrynosoma platyrhinos]|uniref:Serpin domain-containing protein n=1 Tax=Phrynosoma platyrhinos TaxID=52577 RepID=A0ABQ7SSM9_PHRPL|nr:hypothetical protein JD844_020805 [Phrynosoma platyrhinos]
MELQCEPNLLTGMHPNFYKSLPHSEASWKDPFDPKSTKEEDFFVDATTTVKVKMMYQVRYHRYLRDEELSCWVVAKPYEGNTISFFILPDEGKMQQVENGLVKKRLTKWFTSFQLECIQLYMPKFYFYASYDVKTSMQKLGVTLVFSGDADLSGISGQPNLKVSKAVHKTVVDVHENGTEAAAVNTPQIIPTSLVNPSLVIIKFNRPFLCVIIDTATNSILQILKVMNPSEIYT